MLKRRTRKRAARRRPLFLLLILAAVALLAAADLPAPGGFDVASARAVSRRAHRSLAGADAAALRRLDALLEQAEEVTRRERERLPWRRDDDALAAAWGRVMTAADEAQRQLRERRRETAERWPAVEAEAGQAVEEALQQARTPGLGRGEIRLAEQAQVALGTARRLAAAGELTAAIRHAETARQRAEEVQERWRALHERFEDREALQHWRRLVEEAIAGSRASGEAVLVVDKLRRRMEVYAGGRQVAAFRVELGARGLRRKLHAGDRATPEGRYRVVEVKTGGATRYYKALLLDYPNDEDRERYQRERRRGNVPAGAGVGSLIEIHGDGGRGKDWTDGCIALTNDEMDRLFRYARLHTPVVIVGTVPRETALREMAR